MAPYPLDPSLSPSERTNIFLKDGPEWKGEKYYGLDLNKSLKLVGLKVRDERDPDKSAPLCTASFELAITMDHCAPNGAMHGGAVAVIFDITTSSAIHAVAKPGFWNYGSSSRTLICSYLRPVKVGETVQIDCEVVALGKRNGLLRGAMYKKESNGQRGVVCYTCEHDKVSVGEPPKL